MARKTAIDKLAEGVNKILKEYDDDINANIDLITKAMGKEGAKALRASSRQNLKKHTGEYAKGWKYAYRKTRRYAKTTIFNEHYALTHLLEYGHVTRNGDQRTYPRTPAHVHIAPIADEITQTFVKEVQSKL